MHYSALFPCYILDEDPYNSIPLGSTHIYVILTLISLSSCPARAISLSVASQLPRLFSASRLARPSILQPSYANRAGTNQRPRHLAAMCLRACVVHVCWSGCLGGKISAVSPDLSHLPERTKAWSKQTTWTEMIHYMLIDMPSTRASNLCFQALLPPSTPA